MTLLASTFFICLWALVTWSPVAQAQFKIPELTSPVVDAGKMISAQDADFLRQLIVQFKQRHQAQIQVLTVKTLSGVPIEQVSIQVTDAWKLGDKKRDDGILLLVAAEERKIRIEVGQGLEGIIPDIKAKQIIADLMSPAFRQSGPSSGIVLGVIQIMKLLDPQFTDADGRMKDELPRTVHERRPRSLFEKYQNLFVFIFMIVIFFLNFLKPGGGRFYRGGGWGGGGFGGGGRGGGGWSGGGGGFSGGGSSGDW